MRYICRGVWDSKILPISSEGLSRWQAGKSSEQTRPTKGPRQQSILGTSEFGLRETHSVVQEGKVSCVYWLVSQHHPENSVWLRGASAGNSTLDRGREEGGKPGVGKGFRSGTVALGTFRVSQ